MNKVFLIGNLTRDPELSETASGISVCRFAIAVNRQGQKRTAVDVVADEVEFLSARNADSDGGSDFSAPAPKKKPTLQAFDDDSDIPF